MNINHYPAYSIKITLNLSLPFGKSAGNNLYSYGVEADTHLRKKNYVFCPPAGKRQLPGRCAKRSCRFPAPSSRKIVY